MKIFFYHINIIAVAAMIISGLCLDSSDLAIKACLISTAYLALYTFRRELMRAIYKVVCFYIDAFRTAGGKR